VAKYELFQKTVEEELIAKRLIKGPNETNLPKVEMVVSRETLGKRTTSKTNLKTVSNVLAESDEGLGLG